MSDELTQTQGWIMLTVWLSILVVAGVLFWFLWRDYWRQR